MARQPESIIKKAVFEYLSACPEFYGWYHSNNAVYDPVRRRFRKHTGGMKKGVSDIIGVWRGVGVAIEIKTPDGKLSPDQVSFQRDFIEAGGLVATIHSVEEIVDWVRAIRISSDSDDPMAEA